MSGKTDSNHTGTGIGPGQESAGNANGGGTARVAECIFAVKTTNCSYVISTGFNTLLGRP